MNQDVGFVKDFFDNLARNNITYCVLRNLEEILNGDAHDIDMVIDFNKFDKVLDILKLTDWHIHFMEKKDNGNLVTIHVYKIYNSEPVIIHFDLFKTFSWNGYVLINNELMLEDIKLNNGYCESSDSIKSLTMLFSRYLYHGYIKEKYKNDIYHGFKDNEKKVKSIMENFLTKSLSADIYCCIVEQRWNDLILNVRDVRTNIICNVKNNKIQKFIFSVSRLFKHSGVIVTIKLSENINQDKIIDEINKKLERTFSNAYVIINCFNILQIIKIPLLLSKGYIIYTNMKLPNSIVIKNININNISCTILNKMSERYDK